MKTLGIVSGGKAYLPETRAYKLFFERLGFNVDVFDSLKSACDCDYLIIYFGFFPFWQKRHLKDSVVLLGEYHSLSTGRCPRLKNALKRIFNIRCNAYIFLNDEVRKGYFFSKRHAIFRAMGFDRDLTEKHLSEDKEYDFVYCGSTGREGVVDTIYNLARHGYSLAIVGDISVDAKQRLSMENVFLFGRQDRDACYSIMAKAKYGLNYTPNKYPFHLQDSTKVIEYAALGLVIVTNSYKWVDKFLEKYSIPSVRLEDIVDPCSGFSGCCSHRKETNSINELDWQLIIKKSGIAEYFGVQDL